MVGRQTNFVVHFGIFERRGELTGACKTTFPAISLLIPWSVTNRLVSCGFCDQRFLSWETFPAVFPEQGIAGEKLERV